MKNTGSSSETKIKSKRAEKIERKPTPRHQYLMEKEKIKNEIGDLEQIRITLGLSQRRICQLLLVDPSAWTRWNKFEAPPHIFQALKWLLELRKVNPEAAGPSNISSRVDFIQSSTHSKMKSLEESLALLERAVALSATAQPAYAAPVYDGNFEEALRAQETRFLNEISQLKAKIELLTALKAKQGIKNKKPSQKKPKQSKTQKKTKAKPKLKAKPKSNRSKRSAKATRMKHNIKLKTKSKQKKSRRR